MIGRVFGLIAIYVGLQLILRGLGMFPEAYSPEWWMYTIGIGLVISPLYLAYANHVRDREEKQ